MRIAGSQISLYRLLRTTVSEFSDDGAPRLGAALAYYTVFAIAPLVIIVVSVTGLFFSNEAVRGELFHQLAALLGTDGAKFIEDAVAGAEDQQKSFIASVIGVGVLLFGATGVFLQLQDALNIVWDVASTKKSWIDELFSRWVSLTMVLGIGFLLLVSLVLTTFVSLLADLLPTVPIASAALIELLNIVASFTVITFLFALMYRLLPGVRLQWKDVWFSAMLTSFLFVIGKTLLGIYLGRAAIASAYGAAGTVVIVLIWVYYSAQIFLFGAECTQVLARMRNRSVTLRPGFELRREGAWILAPNQKS